jgi:hypothetical protein
MREHRTRNLEIPGLRFAHPGMTELHCFASLAMTMFGRYAAFQ